MRGITKETMELMLSILLVVLLVAFAFFYFVPGTRQLFEQAMARFGPPPTEVPPAGAMPVPGAAGCTFEEIAAGDSAATKLQKLVRYFDPTCTRNEPDENRKVYGLFTIQMRSGETVPVAVIEGLKDNFTAWDTAMNYYILGGADWRAPAADNSISDADCWKTDYSDGAAKVPSLSWLDENNANKRGAIVYKNTGPPLRIRISWWQTVIVDNGIPYTYVRPLVAVCGPIT